MPKSDVAPAALGEASWIVSDTDLASALSQDHRDTFPDVFATARMVALMELAAARALSELLEEGELSVGVLVNVTHTAATPPGARVTAEARYTGREGKFFCFDVLARDDGGEIGRGKHQRAIIRTQRLLEGASRRRRG
ncbi:MAG TPA: hotdog domain-containing protein [Thermoanaerobaculia bacterium]